MSALETCTLRRATSLDEALADLGEESLALAGGTELVPAIKMGLRFPTSLVDLKRIDEIYGISSNGDHVRIGAATTHSEVSRHPAVRDVAPSLAACASAVGNVRVRSTGTIGGNLAFAEPRSDLACLLIALGAWAIVAGPSGRRQPSIDELVVAAYETDLSADEVIVTVVVPRQPAGARYWKFQTAERPVVGVAVVPGESATRIVVGAVTERPVVADIRPGDVDAVERFVAELPIIDDLTGNAGYKRHVLREHLIAALGTSTGGPQ